MLVGTKITPFVRLAAMSCRSGPSAGSAEEGLLLVFDGDRPDRWVGVAVGATDSDRAHVAEMAALVSGQGVDLHSVVRRDGLLPVLPEPPTVGHRVGDHHPRDATAVPVPMPPFG